MALEARIVYDGAMAATVIDTSDAVDAPEPVAQEHTECTEAAPAPEVQLPLPPAATEDQEARTDTLAPPTGDASDALSGTGSAAPEPGTDASDASDVSETSDTADTTATPVPAEAADMACAAPPSEQVLVTDAIGVTDLPEPAAPPHTPVELVFVDAAVQDITPYIGQTNARVIVLDASRDGVEQIAEALQSVGSEVDAIHIVSHGGEGVLFLGNTTLTAQSMQDEHLQALTLIGQALSEDGDILIYGCDFAAGDAGLQAAMVLGGVTGADIAASDDATGHESLGGDWTLERSVGDIEADTAAATDWLATLAPPTVSVPGSQTIAEDGSLTFSVANGNAITVTPDSPTALVTVTLSVPSPAGVLVLAATSGLIDLSGNGTDSLSFSGLASDVNAALDGLVFMPAADFNTGSPASPLALSWQVSTPASLGFVNAGFESPDIPDNSYQQLSEGTVPGWDTDASDNLIEIWGNGWNGLNALDGNQFAELNAAVASTLSQTVTPPSAAIGSTLQLSFAHMARTEEINGHVDTIRVEVVDHGADGVLGTADDSVMFSQQYTNPDIAWVQHVESNVGTVTGNPVSVRFTAVDTASQSATVGNFLDAISLDTRETTSGQIDITVNPVNDAPVATDDSATATEDTPFTSVIDLDANDTDLDGDALSVVAGTFPTAQGGTITIATDGSYTYTPPADFHGSDSVNYTVTDGLATDTGTLNITVSPANDAPVAVDDTITAVENRPYSSIIDLDANDTDLDGDTLSVVAGTFPTAQGGSITLAADGSYTYTPPANFHGSDSVTYTVTDGTASDTGTLNILVESDFDGDGVGDLHDIDDDGDGITDRNEGIPGESPSGVSGLAGWFEVFTTPNGVVLDDSSTTSTITLPSGTVTATITHTGVPVASINTDATRPAGSFLELYANPGNEGFRGVGSGGSYTLTYTFDQPIDIFVFDAERSEGGESYSMVSDGSGFELLDAFNLSNASLVGLGTQSLTVTALNPLGSPVYDCPVIVAVSRGVTEITIEVTQASFGKTGVGIGAFSEAGIDVDGDGHADHLDIDSDNDGITDNVEAQSTAGYTTPSGIDSDGNGLDDAYESSPGAGEGLNPVDTDSDYINDLWDSDSDDDGSEDIAERGDGQPTSVTDTTDTDGDGLLNIFEGSQVDDGADPNDENLSGDNFNLRGAPTLLADGSNAVPLSNDLIFRDTNDAPVATDDSVAATEDTPFTSVIDLDANDTDLDGDTLSVVAGTFTTAQGGSITIAVDGSYTYTPPANFNGSDSVIYTVTDGLSTDTGTLDITVAPVNDAPQGTDATLALAEDGTHTFSSADFGFSDADPDSFHSVIIVSLPSAAQGVLTLSGVPVTAGQEIPAAEVPNLVFTPVPNLSGNGLGAFTFQVRDDGGTVTVRDQIFTEDFGQGLTRTDFAGAGVSATTTYTYDGTGLVEDGYYAIASSPSGMGPWWVNPGTDNTDGDVNGQYLFVNASFTPGEFYRQSVTVSDDGLHEVSVALANANNLDIKPDVSIRIYDATGTVLIDSVSTGDLPPVTAWADYGLQTDLAAGTYQFVLVNNAPGGAGNDLYIDDISFSRVTQVGQDTDQTPNTIRFDITAHNDPPTAVDDAITATEDTPFTSVIDLDANDTDLDGDTLSVAAGTFTTAQGGSITIATDGSYTYTPPANFHGSDSVTYTVTDGALSDTGTLNITVTSVNDAPVAVDDGFAIQADSQLTEVGNALANDSDIEHDARAITLVDGVPANVGQVVTGDAGGLFTVYEDGTVAFDPAGDFDSLAPGATATTSVSYTVSDGHGGEASATITVTVTGANEAPTARDDAFAVDEDDAPTTVGNLITGDNGAGVDSDNDGGTLSVVAINGAPALVGVPVAGSGGGQFTVQPDGRITFDPGRDFDALGEGQSATTTLSYTVSDGQGGTDTATVTITVTGRNEVPAPRPTPPAPAPGPAPAAPTPEPAPEPAPDPVPAPLAPSAPGDAPATEPARNGTVTPSTPPTLHVSFAVNLSQTAAALDTLVPVLGYPLLNEALATPSESLTFCGGHWQGPSLLRELVFGQLVEVEPQLYVQKAVRYEALTGDEGLFVQKAVRASQVESAVRSARADAWQSATPGVATLFDPFSFEAQIFKGVAGQRAAVSST